MELLALLHHLLDLSVAFALPHMESIFFYFDFSLAKVFYVVPWMLLSNISNKLSTNKPSAYLNLSQRIGCKHGRVGFFSF